MKDPAAINEADAEDIARFKRISIPMRRVYPQLIVDKIVSVQPMMQPATDRFYESQQRRSRKPVRRSLDTTWESADE